MYRAGSKDRRKKTCMRSLSSYLCVHRNFTSVGCLFGGTSQSDASNAQSSTVTSVLYKLAPETNSTASIIMPCEPPVVYRSQPSCILSGNALQLRITEYSKSAQFGAIPGNLSTARLLVDPLCIAQPVDSTLSDQSAQFFSAPAVIAQSNIMV